MNRLSRDLALAVLFLACGGLAAAAIGETAPELELGPMLKGEKFRLADKRGQVVVLHFWKTRCPPCAEAVPQISELADRYRGKVTFLAVGTEFPDRLRQEPHWKEFRCPVVSDALLRLSEEYLVRQKHFPADAVIGADGKVLWIGPTVRLAGVLDEVLAGKYDLKAAVELDRFNGDMADAMAKKDLPRALKTLRDRRKAFPDDLELAVGEANILAGPGRKPDEALAVLDRALADHPKAFNLHYAKLQILRTMDASARERRIAACEAIAREFQNRPALLTQLAAGMMKQPVGSFDLLGVWHLAHAACRATVPMDAVERGNAAATLARCYYYMGMADRAMLLQAEAVKAFGKNREAARAAKDLAFYRDALAAADAVRKLERK